MPSTVLGARDSQSLCPQAAYRRVENMSNYKMCLLQWGPGAIGAEKRRLIPNMGAKEISQRAVTAKLSL